MRGTTEVCSHTIYLIRKVVVEHGLCHQLQPAVQDEVCASTAVVSTTSEKFNVITEEWSRGQVSVSCSKTNEMVGTVCWARAIGRAVAHD